MDIEYTHIENELNNHTDTSYDHYYEEMTYESSEENKDKIIKYGVSRYNNIMGITCYMNSILHILQQIPIFVKYIYNFEFEGLLLNDKNNYVIYELYRLFKISIEKDNSIITPKTFKKIIGEKNNMWNEFNHQDSQEFFNFLISQIKEEIGSKSHFISSLNCHTLQNMTISDSIDNIIATNMFINYKSYEYSPLNEMFNGLFKNTCLCTCCKSINIKFEPFLTLAIDINTKNEQVELYDCLDMFCDDQQLDTNNKRICDFCGLSNKSYTKSLLWTPPKILVIHIKRFGITTQKITTKVNYPIKNLDLSKYIDPKSQFKTNCKYDLIGINLHQSLGHCKNINAGHYTSIIKNMINHKWYLYNDSNEPKLQTSMNDLQNKDAYLLFYYRHN